MKFYSNLYIGDSVKNIRKVKWKLRHNAGQIKVYVITLAKGNDLLEIYHCAFLQQAYYKKYPPFIVGVASGYDEAVLLTQKIIMDVSEKIGNYKIKDYFMDEVRNNR